MAQLFCLGILGFQKIHLPQSQRRWKGWCNLVENIYPESELERFQALLPHPTHCRWILWLRLSKLLLDKINLVNIKNCHLRLDPTTCTKQLSIDIKSETRLLFQFQKLKWQTGLEIHHKMPQKYKNWQLFFYEFRDFKKGLTYLWYLMLCPSEPQ